MQAIKNELHMHGFSLSGSFPAGFSRNQGQVFGATRWFSVFARRHEPCICSTSLCFFMFLVVDQTTCRLIFSYTFNIFLLQSFLMSCIQG